MAEREAVRGAAEDYCAVIVGKPARDGGRPCGHHEAEHEVHDADGRILRVCRPCREGRVPWSKDLPCWPEPGWSSGADHPYAPVRTVGVAFRPPLVQLDPYSAEELAADARLNGGRQLVIPLELVDGEWRDAAVRIGEDGEPRIGHLASAQAGAVGLGLERRAAESRWRTTATAVQRGKRPATAGFPKAQFRDDSPALHRQDGTVDSDGRCVLGEIPPSILSEWLAP